MITFNPDFATVTNTETGETDTIGAVDITDATPEELASILGVHIDPEPPVTIREEGVDGPHGKGFAIPAPPAEIAEELERETAELRREYRGIRNRSGQSPAVFNAAVELKLLALNADPETATPKQWLRAAKLVHFRCGRCAGTGAYITGTVNGVPTGPGGICYRCEGKGFQTDADRRRNFGYDNYAIVRAVRAMIG